MKCCVVQLSVQLLIGGILWRNQVPLSPVNALALFVCHDIVADLACFVRVFCLKSANTRL